MSKQIDRLRLWKIMQKCEFKLDLIIRDLFHVRNHIFLIKPLYFFLGKFYHYWFYSDNFTVSLAQPKKQFVKMPYYMESFCVG